MEEENKNKVQVPELQNSDSTQELIKCKYLQEEILTRIYTIFTNVFGEKTGTQKADDLVKATQPAKLLLDSAIIESIEQTITDKIIHSSEK